MSSGFDEAAVVAEIARLKRVLAALEVVWEHLGGTPPISQNNTPAPSRKQTPAQSRTQTPPPSPLPAPRGGGTVKREEGPRLRGDSGKIAGEIRKLAVGQRFGVKEILIAAGWTSIDEIKRKWPLICSVVKALKESEEIKCVQPAHGPNAAVYERL